MNEQNFIDLGVTPDFVEKLRRCAITTPTAIQHLVIPKLYAGEPVLFRSATGTGKTFAYLLPFLGKLTASNTGPALLIAAPTLELCSQIKREVDYLLSGTAIHASLIIGSASISRQIESLKKDKPAVIVGNPSRLVQLVQMGKLKLHRVQSLVLDEGDRLVADEQYADTTALCSFLPKNRQTTACSATMSAKSRELLLPLFCNPTVTVLETDEQEILREHIRHWAFFAEKRRKIGTLYSFLTASKVKKALVFIGTGGQIGNIVSQLQYRGLAVAGLYGDLDKRVRKQSLDGFRSGSVRVLVSSDLAARGLDIPSVSHIIALDVPADAEGYLHRAGRTARAGAHGIMVTIGDAEEMHRLAALEKRLEIVIYPKALYQGQIVDAGV
jgi:superfamily II DNA/RNA helicase